MTTKRRAGAVTLALLLASSGARAQQSPQQSYQRTSVIVAGSIFGAVDLFFITYDLVLAERAKEPSRALAWTEVALMTIQLASGISMVASALQPDQRLQSLGIDRELFLPVGAVLATVSVPLLVHGVRHSNERTGSGLHALRVVPARVGDARANGPGMMLCGVF